MIEFFTDPVLFAPTIGSMLMCCLAAFVGTFAVLKRQSLVGETLSHACYPGVVLALLLSKLFFEVAPDAFLMLVPMIGASLSCLLGMYLVQILTLRFKVTQDSALCFVLASFFGLALVVLSLLQSPFPTLYKELQSYLFGQAATQTNIHIVVYAILSLLILSTTILFFRPIKTVIFDPNFAKTIGINCESVHLLLLGIIVSSVVIGIRSLGVVLMSAMLIFPAVSCRFWTVRLEFLLFFSALFGTISGFFGVYFSHQMSMITEVSFPTGPMIVVIASLIFFLSSMLAPQKGILFRAIRRVKFWSQCQQENLLKALWKRCSQKRSPAISRNEIQHLFQAKPYKLTLLLSAIRRRGWIKVTGIDTYEMTAFGMLWGRKILRLHRLWEVYLVEYCGVGKDRVHPSAEEMEHIITKEIENELVVLLDDPHVDPHHQPIPTGEGNLLLP